MSLSTAAKNQMLDALDLSRLSLHTAFPGATGASEVTGGAYAKVAVTFAASSGGARSLSAAANVNVPATTVRWVGVWNAALTQFNGYSPNGGNPKEFIAAVSTDTFTSLAHGYASWQSVVFYGDTVPSPLVEGTVYYVRDVTADTFKVAATNGGSPIDITTAGGSACVVSAITEEVYGGAGTHTISAWSIGLPN